MPRNAIPATEKEIQSVINLILDNAKKTKMRRVSLSHDEIFKAKVLQEDDKQRIRHHLMKDLKEKGFNIAFLSSGYNFTVPSSIDIGNAPPKEELKPTIQIDENKRKDSKTLTSFDTKYIAPPLYKDVKLAVEAGFSPLIFGPAGSGKSRLYEELSARAGVMAFRRALSQVSDPAELIGTTQIVKEDGVSITKFIDGIITRCARNGHFCILDELDNASASANEALKQISEDGGVLVIETEHGTEIIEKHPKFRMCFTANTRGFGDATGLFPNAQQQNNALMSRLRPKFDMDYQPDVEMRVIKEIGLPDKVIKALYDVNRTDPAKNGLVHIIRKQIKDDGIQGSLSFRAIIGLAKMFPIYGWNKSFLYNICNDFDEQFSETLCDLVQSKLGKWARPTADREHISKYEAEIKKNGFAA